LAGANHHHFGFGWLPVDARQRFCAGAVCLFNVLRRIALVTNILGISAFYHDAAACLIANGEIIAAAQEERFTRLKHDPGFPLNAIRYCLKEARLKVEEIDYIGFYDKPLVKFDRLLETYLDYAPFGFPSFLKAMPIWMKEKLWMPELIRTEMAKVEGLDDQRQAKKRGKEFRWRVLFGDHHESHAASAFYPSPFEAAAILTMDGVGEWATSSIGLGRHNEIILLKELRFPHSLGLLYSAFTYYAGFKVNSGEYKVMGLAPYGRPTYVNLIKEKLVEIKEDGSLRLNQEYFGYSQGLRMTNRAFMKLFGGAPRQPEFPLTQKELDLACSIQDITEEVMLKMATFAHRETGMKRLCLAGGVALNCVGNARILRESPFEDLWIQPAAGDAGGALGIALAIWHQYLNHPRTSAEQAGTWVSTRSANGSLPPYSDGMKGAFLGPANTETEIEEFLSANHLPYRKYRREALPEAVAELLAQEKVVGLHQGRMEFGPRALGGRSIIGDPRAPNMQAMINLKIKYRESFRPFAPSVLREQVCEWFDLNTDSPYMLLVAEVREDHRKAVTDVELKLHGLAQLKVVRSDIPAVTHVDYSARVQTVRQETNPLFYEIIKAFYEKTHCPVIVNTSFNVRGEPIVCSLEDSYRCFMRTEMDHLVMETYILDKTNQPAFADRQNQRREFNLD
jgi:carbamoyltransferase